MAFCIDQRQIFLVCVLLFDVTWGAPEYQFSFGRITGIDKLAEDTQKPYYAYFGIPFAQPPVGSLRFRAPQPFSNQNNPNRVISSSRFKPACVQFTLPFNLTSEDCLYLNVYTPPSVNSGGPLKKAMVWIHGGGNIAGSAITYTPSRLVTDYDVIVVTIQYRLGLFGFLNPGSGQEANFALRDQIMAIQWVKNNIREFGGDGNDITVFGMSAGSNSLSLLSLSPMAKGLFTKAIMQSGVANGPRVIKKRPEDEFLNLANNMGCLSWLTQLSFIREKFIDNIMDCLRQKRAFEILFQASGGRGRSGETQTSTATELPGPSVDGVVIPRSPESLLADKEYLQTNGVLDRSYLTGVNNNEGMLALSVLRISPTGGSGADYSVFTEPNQAEGYAKGIAKQTFTSLVTDDVMDFVTYEYTYPRGDQGKADLLNVLGVMGDSNFVAPAVNFARALNSASDTTPVYFYLFDHYPEVIDPNGPLKGSTHGYNVVYIFDRSLSNDALATFYAKLHTPTDQPIYNIVRNSFAQFAKTGVPSSQEYTSWPSFKPETEFYLAIKKNPEIGQRVFNKRMDLWTKILPERAGRSYGSRRIKFY